MNSKKIYLYFPLGILLLCYLIWTPSQLMITDEVSYYFQAKWWQLGNAGSTIIDAVTGTTYSLIEGQYPPGTSFLLSITNWLWHPLTYFTGFIYFLATLLLFYKVIDKLQLPPVGMAVFYLFLPVIFISRTTMSEMPSLLLVACGLYLYINNTSKSYLFLAFITGLSLAFRETNLLLLAPMAFFISKNYIYSFVSFLIGLSFRLFGYFLLTNDALYLKEGYPFGIEYIPKTILVYAVILLVLLPISPLWFSNVPREKLKVFVLSLIPFLCIHLCYSYVGYEYSGYTNGLLLNGRFWIPALPLFALALSYYLRNKSWIKTTWVSGLFLVAVLITTSGISYKSFNKQYEYHQFSMAIKSISEDRLSFIDMDYRTPIFRYIYPFVHDREWGDINILKDKSLSDLALDRYDSFQVITITSSATLAQSNRNKQFQDIISNLSSRYVVENIEELCPGANSCLTVYVVRQKS